MTSHSSSGSRWRLWGGEDGDIGAATHRKVTDILTCTCAEAAAVVIQLTHHGQ